MKVVCRHLGANSNPKPNLVHFLDQDHLVFAFSNQVAVYQLSTNKIIQSIKDQQNQHRAVNCLSVCHHAGKWWIFCGYDSGWIVGLSSEQGALSWKKVVSIKGDPVLSLETISAQSLHILSNDSRSSLKHYTLYDGNLQCVDELNFPNNKIIETFCPYLLGSTLMLFLGSVDQSIYYYEKDVEATLPFEYHFSLLGHQNAITKLTVTSTETEDLLLASSSKDGLIRIWRMTQDQGALKFHKNVQKLNKSKLSIYLESVLSSHECSVTSLSWGLFENKLRLVSCSLDCTLCIWESQEEGWTVAHRLGQLIGNKNAYFDVKVQASSRLIVALNYTGAVLIWRETPEGFVLRQSFSGHSNEVRDIQWDSSGSFLVSVSKDQTTRVWAMEQTSALFHQISRSQIHGYDINTVTTIKVKDNTIDLIVCGADEKVIRVVEPPACFANYLNSFTRANLHLFFNSQEQEAKYVVSGPGDKVLLYQSYSEGGTQVLGLMTKMQRVQKEKITSYYEDDENGVQEDATEERDELSKSKIDFLKPPHEDFLVKHTLWPEINKLYGHPHEIHKIVRSHSSSLLASVCKSLTKEASSIILWNTNDWKILKILPFHSYTVYDLEFSPSDSLLASVSKDRKMAVFSKDFDLVFSYEAHLRAITGLSFDLEEKYILTGSRDKTIKLHSISERKSVFELNMKQQISCVAFSRDKASKSYFVVGCSSGDVFVGIKKQETLEILFQIPENESHSGSVNAIRWNGNLFATCSDDFSVRIYEVKVE